MPGNTPEADETWQKGRRASMRPRLDAGEYRPADLPPMRRARASMRPRLDAGEYRAPWSRGRRVR